MMNKLSKTTNFLFMLNVNTLTSGNLAKWGYDPQVKTDQMFSRVYVYTLFYQLEQSWIRKNFEMCIFSETEACHPFCF